MQREQLDNVVVRMANMTHSKEHAKFRRNAIWLATTSLIGIALSVYLRVNSFTVVAEPVREPRALATVTSVAVLIILAAIPVIVLIFVAAKNRRTE